MAGLRRVAGLVLATLTLIACHKHARDAEDAASSRSLQVEAYDPVIPKSPVKGKLETMASHPEDGAPSSNAKAGSSAPP